MNYDLTNPVVLLVVAVVVLLIVWVVVWVVRKQGNEQRTEQLRARFGPEYDLALREYGSRKKAEAALLDRVNRVSRMTVHPLSEQERARFLTEWEAIQARFVDHPHAAVTEANEMFNSLLQARGYEAGAFDRRAADLSVHHSSLVEPYRRTNAILVRAARNEVTTEELRSAMILYRNLIEELLQEGPAPVVRSEAA